MIRLTAKTSAFSLLLLAASSFAACGEPASSDDDSSHGASGGSGGTQTMGSKGGSAGTAATNGGSAGTSGTGNTAGLPGTGGSGTGGSGTGGTGSGTGGSGTGGAGNAPGMGGSGPGGQSGSAGTPAGGAPMAGSGPSSGGMPEGGSAGQPPMGGAAGSAGATPAVDEPTLVTSAPNAYWKVGTVMEVTSGNADVTVNDTQTSQTFTGFGGTFNEKGWEALSVLSQEDRDRALKLLFDPVEGAKFVYGRIPIGASDYASNRYTLDDTQGNADDLTMEKFSIDRDKMKLIPYIKAALAVNPNIYFWGSPWTPPPWMKDNKNYDKGNMRSDTAVLNAFALYLTKFVEEYGKEGIVVKAVHPQNEPGYAQDYPSCGWGSGSLMATFIGKNLAPTFKEHNITAQIFIGTMSNSTADATLMKTVMNDGTAKAAISGYGLQWGMFDVYSSLGLDKSLQIWQTEHKCGNYPWEGANQSKAPNDQAYGIESWGLIRDWIKKGVNAYNAWNMVLDTVGRSLDTVRPWAQNALLAVDTSSKKLILTPAYYVFRHCSQYVDPGAKLVGTSGGDALAFKNPDGSIVVIMFNSGGAKTAIVSVGGKKLSFAMPGNGWATVNFH
ncbi:MAG TPA: glycoside hydrolase family 30 beta sandwich domain-containing protein [Polyangiaceae bacterium]|nr:glycoside hydrolase family 30 beta sandwich domain-containing protein [Polyangiaceae bacterium]